MRVLCGSALVLGLAIAPASWAQEDGWRVNSNVGAVSDYVFRGVSQTEGDAAVQIGVDATDGFAYVGGWASNVAFPGDDDTNAEIDLYGGIKPALGDWTFDIGAVGYFYTGQPDGADYDYVEAKLGASRSIGRLTFGATLFWSPDFFGAEDDATYLVGDVSFKAMDNLVVSAQVGRQWVSSALDYTHWNVGATYAFNDTIGLDVRYHDTSEHSFGSIYEERVVASLKAGF